MTGMYVASNSTALGAQFNLTRNMGALGDTLTRLSTGLKLNSGKDDPAGLIASELLKAQITGTTKAITNTQRANSLIAMADSSMAMIGNLLNDIKGLVVESANTGTMTAEQIAANQLQVDAALESIDRIARTTNYGGKKILDGSLGFKTAGMGGGLSNVQINSANFGTANAVGVNVNVSQAADYARLVSNGTGVSVDTVFDVIGNRGSATISVGADSTNDDIAAAINRSTDSTGVLAYVEGKESYGSITLSSTGAGNDILITALEAGLDNGNYEFRITRGAENDARIVQEAAAGKPGIVEISLVSAYESRFNNFAGLFDIAIDTTGRTDSENAETSVTMQQGAANGVVYNASNKAASTNVISGKSLVAQVTDADGKNINSQLNGWTIAIDDRIATAADHSVADTNTKTIYVNSTSFGDKTVLNDAIKNALANTVDGTVADFDALADVNVSIIGNPSTFANGDRFTFANGAAEGEVSITYAAGATANDILKMLNSAPNVAASLASGVNGNAVIANQPNGLTSVHNGGVNEESRFTSGATSQEVIDLINSKLGDKFLATGLSSDTGTGGRVGFQDASAIHGDINMGNALRFSGMDNGPLVRLTTLGTNGMPVANQQLGVNIIHPTEADKQAGIHTPILEIKLATDAQGNSITTASDIAKLFNTLTAEQTMGVSVSQLYPPGVDPNGRVFGIDECGKAFVVDTCPTPIDGIVQPTGAPGACGPMEGDLVLLGGNQMIVADNAVAKIAGHNRPGITTQQATSLTSNAHIEAPANQVFPGNTTATNSATFSNELAQLLDGITIAFGGATSVHADNAFNATTGTLTLGTTNAITPVAIISALNHALSGMGDDGDVLEDVNAWLLAEQGRTITSEQAAELLNADDAISANTVAVTDTFTIAYNDPSEGFGPQLTFSDELAKAFNGVEFRFTGGNANTTTWEDGILTLGLGNAGTVTQATVNGWTDAELLAAVNAALTWADTGTNTTLRADLGLDPVADGGPAIQASGAEKHNLQIALAGATAAVIEATSSRTTMDYTPPVSNTARTGAVEGATEFEVTTTPGSFDFTFNGVTFTLGTSFIDDVDDFDLTFATAATNLWTTGSLAVGLAATDTALGGPFEDAAEFATALQDRLNAAAHTYATNAATDSPNGEDLSIGTNNSFFSITVKNDPGSDTAWQDGYQAITPTLADFITEIRSALSAGATAAREANESGNAIENVTTEPADASGQTLLTFDNTSAMNGMTFTFTREEAREGFNATTGQLTVFLGSEFEALQAAAQGQPLDSDAVKAADAALRAAVNGAIAANWEAIRSFTGEGGTKTNTSVLELDGPVKLAAEQDEAFTVANAIADAAAADNPFAKAADGKTMITGSYVEGNVIGVRGIATDDGVMSITAKEAGTHMAGISIHFVNDVHSGLNQWNTAYDAKYAAGDFLPDLKVELHTKTDGSRELIITGNLGSGTASEVNAGLLARALNGAMMKDVASGKEVAFSSMFDANAMQFSQGDNPNGSGMAGSVLFNRDVSGAQGVTVGGYKISSGTGSATSSGIGMLGQSDANERLIIESEELGSGQSLEINLVKGYINFLNAYGESANSAVGQDMLATINGIRATADGNHIGINTSDLSVSMSVANGVGSTGFTITGGGALFQLGPDVVSQQQMRVGIASMLTTNLGGKDGQLYLLKEGGVAALNSNDAGRRLADRIVNQAIENVASQRGRLGALQRGSLEPNIMALQDSLVAMTEANALITNADFAVESSNLTRLQLLIQAGMQTLGIANQMPQYAASLVR